MRRLVDEPNGLTEALIGAALQHAAAAGVSEVSLNFAGFSHLMVPREDVGLCGRIARRALGLVHGRFQLDRLARFNERFGAQWRPRYLVWRGALSLPRVGLRVLQAEAYIDAPAAPALPRRWHAEVGPLPAR
jgi:lysyl-tRNA synthetase class 2